MSDRLDRAIIELVRDTVATAPAPPEFSDFSDLPSPSHHRPYRALLVAAAVMAMVAGVSAVGSNRGRQSDMAAIVAAWGQPPATTESPELVVPGSVPEDLVLIKVADVWLPGASQQVLQRFTDRNDPTRELVLGSSSPPPWPGSSPTGANPPVPADARPEVAAWTDYGNGRGGFLWSHERSSGTAVVRGMAQPEARALLERLSPAADGRRFELAETDPFELVETVQVWGALPASEAQWTDAGGGRTLRLGLVRMPGNAAALTAQSTRGSSAVRGGRQVIESGDMVSWASGQTLVSLSWSGLEPDEIDRVIGSMAALSEQEWAALIDASQGVLAALPLTLAATDKEAAVELRETPGSAKVLCLVLATERSCSTDTQGGATTGVDLETAGPSASYTGAVHLGGRRYLVGIVSASVTTVKVSDAPYRTPDAPAMAVHLREGGEGRRWFVVEFDPASTSFFVELIENGGGSSGTAGGLPRS